MSVFLIDIWLWHFQLARKSICQLINSKTNLVALKEAILPTKVALVGLLAALIGRHLTLLGWSRLQCVLRLFGGR